MDQLPKLEKVRGKTDAPAKPPYFDASLVLIGKKNPLGEPNLRVSWGWDLRTFRNGNPEALKYPGPFLNRWILEKWLAPEFFGSKHHWEEHRYRKVKGDGVKVDLLGEFPSRGHYGMVMPLTKHSGEFLPLDDGVLTFIEWVQGSFDNAPTLNVYSDAKRVARLQQQMAEEDARLEAAATKEANEFEDYVLTHQDDINQDRAYSLPSKSIWTPDGEHNLIN